jgi:hypothetical protein
MNQLNRYSIRPDFFSNIDKLENCYISKVFDSGFDVCNNKAIIFFTHKSDMLAPYSVLVPKNLTQKAKTGTKVTFGDNTISIEQTTLFKQPTSKLISLQDIKNSNFRPPDLRSNSIAFQICSYPFEKLLILFQPILPRRGYTRENYWLKERWIPAFAGMTEEIRWCDKKDYYTSVGAV